MDSNKNKKPRNRNKNKSKKKVGEIAAATSSPPENVPRWKATLSRLSTFSVYRLFLALIAFVVVVNLFTYQYVPPLGPLVTQLFSLIPWEANHPDRPVLPVDLPPRNTTPKSGTTPGTFGLALSDVRVTSFFVFGDSTVDAGNFNLMTHPYGVDLPLPRILTPRFTNGHTIADLFALKLQTEIPRAFNGLRVDELRGKININFASGGCGFLARTYPIWCTSVGDQVMQFITSAAKHVEAESSIFFISAGANDYVVSFTADPDPFKNSSKYAEELVGKLETYMKVLYQCGGARIFVINKLAPIGCIPDKRNLTTGICDEMLNEAARDFNKKLERTLLTFKLQQDDAQIYLADTQRLFAEISKGPLEFGLKDVTSPCCGYWSGHKYDCKNDTPICPKRDEFLFFDGAHFTEKVNEIFVDKCLEGKVCYPI